MMIALEIPTCFYSKTEINEVSGHVGDATLMGTK